MKNRILSLALSTAMAFTPAAAALAEGNYAAGDMTKTVVAESYTNGNQIEMTAKFNLELDESLNSERAAALASLAEKTELRMSFYDDFGTSRIRAEVVTDNVPLFKADALLYENGSAQIMTNLTGKLVLALPEGTITPEGLNFDAMEDGESDVPFEELPAFERLRLTTLDAGVVLLSHLLGWTSSTQMETGDLYTFDDTYLEATETRDAVAQRMVGKIAAWSFNELAWYIAATFSDQQGEFQQALADSLAELGVTRYQVRQVVDHLLTEETIDPALDYVQPSGAVKDDGALCTYDDVSYFFKKLFKSTEKILDESTENTLSLIVSYDDFGQTVGIDAVLPQYTQSLPYSGTYSSSVKTDDNFQTRRIAHGEFQLRNDRQLVGDMTIKNGEDVDGVNESFLVGTLDLLNQKDQTSVGFGVDTALNYAALEPDEENREVEQFDGKAALSLRKDSVGMDLIALDISGKTAAGEEDFVIQAKPSVNLANVVSLNADVEVTQGEYDEAAFAGGQAIDLTNLSEKELERVKREVLAQGAKLSVKLATHPKVLADVMTLISK